MNIDAARQEIQRFGWPATVQAKVVRAFTRAAHLTVYRAMALERPRPEHRDPPAGYTHGFLDEAALRRFAQDPTYEMTGAFIDRALEAGDRCYGVLLGDALASFGWYSRCATPLDDDVVISVDPPDVYYYKAYTHPDHRGKRLHAVGVTRALEAYAAEGAATFVTYVEVTNLSSLRSHYRMGYEDFGNVGVLRLGSRCHVRASEGCARRGMRCEVSAASARANGAGSAA